MRQQLVSKQPAGQGQTIAEHAEPPPSGREGRRARATRRLRGLLGPEFSRGVLALVAGTGAAQLMVIGTSPILTRLYSPSDFGIYAVVSSILSVLITVTCLAYDFAIPLPESDDAAANVAALCLVVAITFSSATLLVLLFAGPALLALAGASVLGPAVLLLPLGQLGGGAVSVFRRWALRTKAYSEIAANQFTQSATLVVVQVGLGVPAAGAAGLLVGAVAGSIAGSSRLSRVAWLSHSSSFRRVSRAGIRLVAARYVRFPILAAPSAFLNSLGLQAPLLMIVALYGTAIGGQFTLAQRVVALPATLVTGAIGQVYFAEAAALAREQSDLRALFLRTTRSIALMAAGPIAVIALVSPLVFGLVFGEEWREAGLFVSILAPMYYVYFVANPTGATLDVLERQDLNLIREIVRIALMTGAALLAALARLSPVGGVAVLSLAGCLTYVVYGGLSWRAISDHRRRTLDDAAVITEVVPAMTDWPEG